MYTNNRDAYRQTFFVTWDKYKKKLPLEPVENQLVEIMLIHPEYHDLLEKPTAFQQQEFTLEENPFMHMSLHIAVREQLAMNKPFGIAAIQQQLLEKLSDQHAVEHRIMQCLGKILWEAQQTGQMPSEEDYLQALQIIK